jgi:hypothetical protein
MELREDAAFPAIWEHIRARSEALAGGPLRVVQLYANGHTYRMGGNLHRDDGREGTFTLLYYPNPEWQDDWDGQTIFYDAAEEIALSVRLRPNRAIFFDARTWLLGASGRGHSAKGGGTAAAGAEPRHQAAGFSGWKNPVCRARPALWQAGSPGSAQGSDRANH